MKKIFAIIVIGLLAAGAWWFMNNQPQAQSNVDSNSSVATVSDSGPVEINWIISHRPLEYFLRAAETFKELVETESNGGIVVNINTQPEVLSGDDVRENRQLLEAGYTDMMQVYVREYASEGVDTDVMFTPQLFASYDHIDAVVDGEVGSQIMNRIDEESETKALAFTFSGGYMSYVSLKEEISELADLEGMNVMTPSDSLSDALKVETVSKLDENGKRIPFTNRYQNPNTDAVEVTYADALLLSEEEEIVSLLHSRHRVLFTVLGMNEDFFNGLSQEHQEIVMSAAKMAAKAEREIVKEDEEKLVSVNDGFVTEVSDADKTRIQEIADAMVASYSESKQATVQAIRALAQ